MTEESQLFHSPEAHHLCILTAAAMASMSCLTTSQALQWRHLMSPRRPGLHEQPLALIGHQLFHPQVDESNRISWSSPKNAFSSHQLYGESVVIGSGSSVHSRSSLLGPVTLTGNLEELPWWDVVHPSISARFFSNSMEGRARAGKKLCLLLTHRSL